MEPRSFSAPVAFVWLIVGLCLGCEQQPEKQPERDSVSGMNLIKQGSVWLGSSVVECPHGKRESLGSSPGQVRPRSFSAPVKYGGQCGSVKKTVSSVSA